MAAIIIEIEVYIFRKISVLDATVFYLGAILIQNGYHLEQNRKFIFPDDSILYENEHKMSFCYENIGAGCIPYSLPSHDIVNKAI